MYSSRFNDSSDVRNRKKGNHRMTLSEGKSYHKQTVKKLIL